MEYILLGIGLLAGIVIGYLFASKGQSSKTIESQKQLESVKSERVVLEQQLHNVHRDLEQRKREQSELTNKYERSFQEAVSWKSKHEAASVKLEEQRDELNRLQEKFTKDFEVIANKILDEKSAKFTDQNKQNLDALLNPLKERISEFQKKKINCSLRIRSNNVLKINLFHVIIRSLWIIFFPKSCNLS